MLLKDVSSFEVYRFEVPKEYEDAGYIAGIEKVLENLDKLPIIDAVEVMHGRWEEYQEPHIICCSVCDWGTGVDKKHFKYCPYCGAKMDLED